MNRLEKAILLTERALTLKGYATYTRRNDEFDILAINERGVRIRIKVVVNPYVVARAPVVSKKLKDSKLPFDFYAVRLRKRGFIIYPSIKMGGECIETVRPKKGNRALRCYWWEDFKALKRDVKMRTISPIA